MRILTCLLLFLLFAGRVSANEASVPVNNVLSAVSGYQDGDYYRAVLVQGKEDADLYIFTRPSGDLALSVYAKDIVFTGIGGSDAYLTRAENGSLQLISQNFAIGRHRWEQKLTIVHRDRRFIIGGFTYSYYDTLAVDTNGDVKTGACDLNLLTGEGVRDGKRIQTQMATMPVEDWKVDTWPADCDDE